MLGEGVGRKTRIAMLLRTGRILRPVQSYCLGPGQAEYKVRWEARGIVWLRQRSATSLRTPNEDKCVRMVRRKS